MHTLSDGFTIGWPALQENARENSGMFTTTPLMRYCAVECGSVTARLAVNDRGPRKPRDAPITPAQGTGISSGPVVGPLPSEEPPWASYTSTAEGKSGCPSHQSKGPLSKPTTADRPSAQEPLFMPQSGHGRRRRLSRCSPAFDLSFALAKCDFPWSAGGGQHANPRERVAGTRSSVLGPWRQAEGKISRRGDGDGQQRRPCRF